MPKGATAFIDTRPCGATGVREQIYLIGWFVSRRRRRVNVRECIFTPMVNESARTSFSEGARARDGLQNRRLAVISGSTRIK